MKAKNQKNLKALIKVIKNLPNKRMDMRYTVCSHCGTSSPGKSIDQYISDMPEFLAMGGESDYEGYPVLKIDSREETDSSASAIFLGGDKDTDSSALAVFLGIDKEVAFKLCTKTVDERGNGWVWRIRPDIPYDNVTRSDVVKVLKQWLE